MPQLKPLPDCEGPKLECFIDDITTCDFKIVGKLGVGVHSQVWKAEINGKVYAIKTFFYHSTQVPDFEMCPIDEDVVYQYDDGSLPIPSSDITQATIDSLRLHATSFYNECRVFGRLKELDREHLAIKAYGYLQFDLSDEKVQRHFLPFGNDSRKHLALIGNKEPHDEDVIRHFMAHDNLSRPIMGIVKEWVDSIEGLEAWQSYDRDLVKRNIGHMPRLLRNVRALHKSGIVVRDLGGLQYLDGQLVDFSFAWTIPHIFGPESGLRPRWSFESMAAWDLQCFQDMLDELDRKAELAVPRLRKHKLTAWPKHDISERLRPRSHSYRPPLPMLVRDDDQLNLMWHRPPFDPARFNWRATQKPTKKGASATGRVTKTKALSKKTAKRSVK
ncbi:uncharacterized protein B0J16DRAFT_319506 [Fusarium flagelliforme]|uniref:uncharacterized protein n=1 Tax=Fusarium flagelliforme TaxID=2675880 RepID=UPI001E8D6348|nr:uncharacterized protein B0J16DRAFT_319506 [Fusarium flagelliforme]KAH7184707.1 hypothetical protein B0J16DRAFT_319506 [Fusarium flagelliforme]